jgi:undecaprenyl-diphosphatase
VRGEVQIVDMDLTQAITLGAVQGITEFLPISSTAHLILVPWLMGWSDPGASFDVALHLGTLVALLFYFRADWLGLLTSGIGYLGGNRTNPTGRLAIFIVLATIPGAAIGALFQHQIETVLRSPLIISITLIALALILVLAERVGRHTTDLDHITLPDALTVGFAQALALIPGVSRSGVTITAGLFRGMTRASAARFSFFLSTPIIAGAVAKKFLDIYKEGLPTADFTPFIAGILVSGVVGYLSIAFLIKYLSTHNTYVFVYYRIALGILVFVAFLGGFR